MLQTQSLEMPCLEEGMDNQWTTDGPWVSSRISEAYFLIQAIQTMFALFYNRKIYFPLKFGNSIRYEKKSC